MGMMSPQPEDFINPYCSSMSINMPLDIDAMALTSVGTPRSLKEPTPARYMARVRKQRVLYNAQRPRKSIIKKSNKSPVIS